MEGLYSIKGNRAQDDTSELCPVGCDKSRVTTGTTGRDWDRTGWDGTGNRAKPWTCRDRTGRGGVEGQCE